MSKKIYTTYIFGSIIIKTIMLLKLRRFIMDIEKTIEDLLARVAKLEAQVAALGGAPAEDTKETEKKCLPGYNSCEI